MRPEARALDALDRDDECESVLDIALLLAARGLSVFPCSANKRPAISEDQGGRGCLDATSDLDAVRTLFAHAPNATLVGVACGPASGVDILDVDPRHGGDVWEQENLSRLPETLTHSTPSGGRHHVFRHHLGVRNRQGAPASGVDVRGQGGYAIWPPCAGYAVLHNVEPAEWPQWLLEQIIRAEPPPRPFVPSDPAEISDARLDGLLRSLLTRLSQAPEGQKHEVLLRIARTIGGYAHLFGMSDDQLVALMLDALPATVADWRNAEKTARDGLAYGRAAPLELEDRPNPYGGQRPNGAGASAGADTDSDATPADEPPPPEPPAWQRNLIRNDKGNAFAVLANALTALREAPVWQGVFAWNEFASRVTIMRHLPGPRHIGLEIPRELGEADISRVTDWLQHRGIRISSSIALEAIRTVADHHRFHPVRSYLLELHWDGVPRIDRWLINHLGAEDNSLNQAFGAKWLIGCVARIMQPGCKLDTALILESRQGLMKSTALATLGNPWFTDHMPDLGSKDAMEQLQGVWIIELAELSSLSRVESARIKAFLSTPSDRFRPSYGRAAANHPRQCGFSGSINPAGSGYLRDETGNRRFWCVKCAVDWPDERRVDIAALANERDQLWAEAVHRYQQHEPWWLDTEAEAQAEVEAEERFESDSRESIVRNYLRGRSYTRMTELFSEPCLNIPTDRQTRGTQTEIGRIMAAMKWARRRRRNRHQELEWVYLAPGKHLSDVRDE